MPASSETMPHGAGQREKRFAPVDFKSVDAQGTFYGYASLFKQADLTNDVVMPGAFRQSLRERGTRGIKMLFQHNADAPIGVWEELREDARGLFARGRLMQEVARAREVLSLMRAGALDGLSIGFRTRKGHTDARSGIRRLFDIDLWEISVVTFPMHPQARVSGLKRAGGYALPTTREFERWLTRNAGFSRSQARAVIRSGYKSLAGTQDAAGGTGDRARMVQAIRRAARAMAPSPLPHHAEQQHRIPQR